MTNTEIKVKGFDVLSRELGLVEMEKFITIIQTDKFDYTNWRKNLFNGLSGEQISKLAMKNRNAHK